MAVTSWRQDQIISFLKHHCLLYVLPLHSFQLQYVVPGRIEGLDSSTRDGQYVLVGHGEVGLLHLSLILNPSFLLRRSLSCRLIDDTLLSFSYYCTVNIASIFLVSLENI